MPAASPSAALTPCIPLCLCRACTKLSEDAVSTTGARRSSRLDAGCCGPGRALAGLGAVALLLWGQEVSKVLKAFTQNVLVRKEKDLHTPQVLLSLEESPGPTKLWRSFLLLTAVGSSGCWSGRGCWSCTGGQWAHSNANSKGKGFVGQSHSWGCRLGHTQECWAALAPPVTCWHRVLPQSPWGH